MKNVKRRDLSGFSRSYLEIDRTMIRARSDTLFSCAQMIPLRGMQCRFRHSDSFAGTWRRRKSWQLSLDPERGDNDSRNMRRLGDYLFVSVGIRRNLCCFSLWLRRRQNRIR